MSYLEIYNENLRDLLGAPAGGSSSAKDVKKKADSLDVRSIDGKSVAVPGLTSVAVTSAVEVGSSLTNSSPPPHEKHLADSDFTPS